MRIAKNKLVRASAVTLSLAACLFGCVAQSNGIPEMPLDLKTTDPQRVLALLKSQTDPHFVLTIAAAEAGWVKERDLPQLIALLDADQPCAPVTIVHSSVWPPSTTVGEQAALMIQGFRTGKYPPRLNPTPITDENKREIRAWWAARSAGATAP